MRKQLIFVAVLSWLVAESAAAQISSCNGVVDFGEIRETEGPKTIRVYVRNQGSEQNAILKVRPTCGCTAAEFQQEAFLPGDSAWIDLTYDPTRRPGRFEKGVKVYPVEGEMIRIPITGVVFSSPETIESLFPVDAGLLHLSSSTLMTLTPLGPREGQRPETPDKRTLWLDVYNSGDAPVWLRLESGYEAIETQPFPSPLPPGEKGLVGVYLDPAKEPRTGHLEYCLQLYQRTDTEERPPFEIKLFTEKLP